MERSRQSSTKISRHRLKRDGTPDKADQQPADLKQPEYEGHDPGKICFRFKFGHSLYCRFLRRALPAEAYRHRAAFNRRPYARSRRQKSKIEQVLYNLLDNAINFPTLTLLFASRQTKSMERFLSPSRTVASESRRTACG